MVGISVDGCTAIHATGRAPSLFHGGGLGGEGGEGAERQNDGECHFLSYVEGGSLKYVATLDMDAGQMQLELV